MRLASLAILAAALVLVLAACGVIPGSKPVSTPTRLTDGELSALEILKKSVERQKDIRSFRSTMHLLVSGMGEEVLLSVDIEMAQDGRVRMNSSMGTPDGEMSFAFILAEPDLYMKMPGDDWALIPGGAADGILDQSFSSVDADLLGTLFSTDETPWDSFSVISLGREHVDNVETEHLWVQMDLPQLWEEQPHEMRKFFESVLADELEDFEEFIENLLQMDLEIWIDDEGYTRRTLIGMSMGDMMSALVDQRMFDFNEHFVIELPQIAG